MIHMQNLIFPEFDKVAIQVFSMAPERFQTDTSARFRDIQRSPSTMRRVLHEGQRCYVATDRLQQAQRPNFEDIILYQTKEIVMGLDWREQLSVGNDLLDADHKHLIGVINQAELSLKSKNMPALTAVLENLASYGKIHFAREELVATAVGYPHVAQMHESHEALILRLNQVKQETGDKLSDEACEHFVAFLRDWLVTHVIKEDMKMKPYLTKHSPRFDPRR